MREANIFYKGQLAGTQTNEAGYAFHYLSEYLSLEPAEAVDLILLLQEDSYVSPYSIHTR